MSVWPYLLGREYVQSMAIGDLHARVRAREVRDKFATQGLDAASSTAAEFSAHIRSEVPKWIRIATSANNKLE